MYFLVFVAMVVTSVGMSLYTPIFGGPDEVAHTVYGYSVVTGQIPMDTREVNAPEFLAGADPSCWKFRVDIPVSCSGLMDSTKTSDVPLETTADDYPPLYYALVSWPMLLISGAKAFFAVRFVSAILFSALAALGIVGLVGHSAQRRFLVPLALALVTPSLYAIAGLVNPQALEIGAGLALGGVLLPLVTNVPDARGRWLVAAPLVAVLILSRPVGPFWAALLCLLIAFAAGWKRVLIYVKMRQFWIFMAAAILATGVWFWWSSISASPGLPSTSPAQCDEFCSFWRILNDAAPQMTFIVAITGWLDASASPLIIAVYGLFLGAVLFWACVIGTRKRRWTTIVGLLVIPAAGLFVQFTTAEEAGPMWQLRYAFPYMFPLFFLAAFHVILSGRLHGRDLARFARGGGVLLLAVTASLAVRASYRFWVGIGELPYSEILNTAPRYAQGGIVMAVTGVAAILAMIWVLTGRAAAQHPELILDESDAELVASGALTTADSDSLPNGRHSASVSDNDDVDAFFEEEGRA